MPNGADTIFGDQRIDRQDRKLFDDALSDEQSIKRIAV
jgi:hypothetical protein